MVYKRVRGWKLGRSLPVLMFVKYTTEINVVLLELKSSMPSQSLLTNN